jgi:hypothetical protein
MKRNPGRQRAADESPNEKSSDDADNEPPSKKSSDDADDEAPNKRWSDPADDETPKSLQTVAPFSSDLEYYGFDHRHWRGKCHSTPDPGLSLTVTTEIFRIDGRQRKLVMSRWKPRTEQKGIVEIIAQDLRRKELVFRRIQFGHEQKPNEEL